MFAQTALLALVVPIVQAQTAPPAAQPPAQETPAQQTPVAPAPAPAQQSPRPAPTQKFHRLNYGVRVRTVPFGSAGIISTTHYRTTTTKDTTFDWNYVTTSRVPKIGGGVAIEVNLAPKWTLRGEVTYQRLAYDKVVDIYWGVDDANTTTDERSHMNRTESTRARLFDAPVMLQYQPWEAGWRSRVFFAAGATGRTISTVKSKNSVTFQNGEVQTNEIAVTPARRTLVGGSFGVGFRVIDDYNIKTTPEIRYTYWSGRMFGSDSTRSPKNQIEIGIGFTF